MNKACRFIFLITSVLVLSACSSTIFQANFDDDVEGEPPPNSPLGLPDHDEVRVYGEPRTNGDWDIRVLGTRPGIRPVSGKGKSLTFWPRSEPVSSIDLISAPVNSQTTRKTVFWKARKKLNEGSFQCSFGGWLNERKIMTIVTVRFTGLNIQLIDNELHSLGRLTLAVPEQAAPEHQIYISYNPQLNQYRVSIQQPGQAEYVVTRSVSPSQAEQVRAAARYGMNCRQFSDISASLVPVYIMDDIVMREEN